MLCKILFAIVIIVICCYCQLGLVTSLECKDEDNQPVDWFFLYKLPIIKGQGKSLKTGLAYMFITAKTQAKWTVSNKLINNNSSIIGNTLNILYSKNANQTVHLLYNDEPPNTNSKSQKGHNKGVVLADNLSGLWLIHSAPKFPAINSSYDYPKTATKFGQSFLCISMNLTTLNNVGIQLQYNHPQIYTQNQLAELSQQIPELYKAANSNFIKTAPFYRKTTLFSLGKTSFVSFAKTNKFAKELYEDLVAPSLTTNLYVETWLNGPGKLTSNCSQQYKVNNINSIKVSSLNLSFNTTHDHSKWAVSRPEDGQQWICVGDINRMEHQKKRGGGTVCLRNSTLTGLYQKLVDSLEACP